MKTPRRATEHSVKEVPSASTETRTIKYEGPLCENVTMASDPDEEERKRYDSAPPLEFLRPGEQQAASPPASDRPAAWVPQPEDYRPPQGWTPPPMAPRGRSNLPTIAGILLLLAGVIGMVGAILNAINLPSVAEYTDFVTNNSPELVATLQVCGLVSIWSQAMAVLGGVMAFQRMNWKLTLVCAIFSLFTLGIVYFEASLIGLIALVVTILARPYFAS